MAATDSFGRDARSIMNTLGNIKEPNKVEESLVENPEKIKILSNLNNVKFCLLRF